LDVSKANADRTVPIVVRTLGNQGVLAGLLGCIFGILGIFTSGLIFVPLAAICAIFGLFRGLAGSSIGGIGCALIAGALTVWGFVVSPSLWMLTSAFILAQHVPTPTMAARNDAPLTPTAAAGRTPSSSSVAPVATPPFVSPPQSNVPTAHSVGWIGVQLRGGTRSTAAVDAAGALVGYVIGGGPAAKAGIEAGDVITSAGGRQIFTGLELAQLIRDSPVGEKLGLVVRRGNQILSVSVTVGDRPSQLAQEQQASSATPCVAGGICCVGSVCGTLDEFAHNAKVACLRSQALENQPLRRAFSQHLSVQRLKLWKAEYEKLSRPTDGQLKRKINSEPN
jgi:hypothetical protein